MATKPKLVWKAVPAWRGVDIYLYFEDRSFAHGTTASLHEVPDDPLEVFQRMADRMVRQAPATEPFLKSILEAVPRSA